MMARHRAQIEELLTNYGEIQMLSLDQWLGPTVWPQLRQTLFRPRVAAECDDSGPWNWQLRRLLYAGGIYSRGQVEHGTPWMVIYPLAGGFSYDPDAAHYKGAKWIVDNIIDTAAKGGVFKWASGRMRPAGSIRRLSSR